MAAITTRNHKMPNEGPLWRRLLWFVVLWGLGVAVILIVGWTIRTVVF